MTSSSSAARRRTFQGTVVKTAMTATASVRVDRRVADKKYGKYYTVSRKFQIHDPQKQAHVGDIILFEECRPVSKLKRWRYLETVKSSVPAEA